MLLKEFVKMGRRDLGEAVANGRKWHRLEDCMSRFTPSYEGAVGLRLAWDPYGMVPESKEEWIAEGLEKYAHDTGLQYVAAEWAALKKAEKEKAAAAEGEI